MAGRKTERYKTTRAKQKLAKMDARICPICDGNLSYVKGPEGQYYYAHKDSKCNYFLVMDE